MQAYRGLEIGTAKPTAAERREVPHHLIDVVEPHDEWSVAQFQSELQRVREQIVARGHRVLLVGGTGLHLRAAVDGLRLPGHWPELRAQFEAQVATDGVRALYQKLQQLDPAAAARIEPDNARRVVRALEVSCGSGQPFSSFGPGLDVYPATDVMQVGLRWDRSTLEQRIGARVHAMIEAGWCDEVRQLRETGRPLSRTAAVAVGYRELAQHLDGECTLDAAIEQIVVRTRQLAARQMRWFRRDPRIRWFDVVADPVAEVLPHVLDLVSP